MGVRDSLTRPFVDDVSSTTISIGYWIHPEILSKLAESDVNLNLKLEIAPGNSNILSDYGTADLKFENVVGTVTPVIEYSGFGTRPKTLSTILCTERYPDSTYIFRLAAYIRSDHAM